jgi:hypothetical protein
VRILYKASAEKEDSNYEAETLFILLANGSYSILELFLFGNALAIAYSKKAGNVYSS